MTDVIARLEIVPVVANEWIYFARARDTEFVKVGFTAAADPGRRLPSLQTGCPFALDLEEAFAAPQSTEAELHRNLVRRRVRARGEWFRLSRRDTRAIVEWWSEDGVLLDVCGRCEILSPSNETCWCITPAGVDW